MWEICNLHCKFWRNISCFGTRIQIYKFMVSSWHRIFCVVIYWM